MRVLLVGLSICVTTACGEPRSSQYHQKLVVLGIDGLDPNLVSAFMHAGKLPNMQKLAIGGTLQRLETTPSPDASAWASFATGMNPGKHGIFGNESKALPIGTSFWTVAGNAGVRSSVLMVPMTFPPEQVRSGELLAGAPTPDLRRTRGNFYYFSSDLHKDEEGLHATDGGIRYALAFNGNVAASHVEGPEGLSLPLMVFWNRSGRSATIEIDGSSVRLDEGEWSKWIDIDFHANPFSHQHGLIEFCLVRATSSLALYASPIHWNPNRPPGALSWPAGFAADVFERVGPYRTLGWSEATSALDAGLIDERLFLDDAQRAFDDRTQVILQRLETSTWDLLVGQVDTLDHIQHVMWRLMDPAHPGYDRAAAARFGETIEQMYRRADAFVGVVAAHLPRGTPLLVMSGYGSHGVTRTFDLHRWLALEGMDGRAIVTATGGIILPPAGRAVEDHLVARLTAELDPTTKSPIVAAVYRREAVYSGPQTLNAPDLQLGMAPGYHIGTGTSVLTTNRRKWSADHVSLDYRSVPGVLISNRPTTTGNPRVVDIAPTVLQHFGVPIPREVDGKPIF
jgi:predicted AlkP superfamily phosphohydrolase/phosphomutase